MPNITERFTAKVVVNDDPEHRARIKVACEDLMGDPESVLPTWIEPLLDWGLFVVPDVDEFVEIEVVVATDEDEVPGQCIFLNPDIRWRGKRHYHEGEEAPTPVHDDFKSANYGKRRGFATPAGHILLFDDTESEEQVRLTWHAKQNDADKYAYLAFDKDGSVVIQNKNGSLFYMDAKNGAVSIIDEHGNLISSDNKGLRLIDKFSNVIDMKDGAIQVLGQKAVTVSCKDAKLNAGNVELGRAATLGIARLTDLVAAATGMALWMSQVATAVNGLVPGSIVPPTPPDFGSIASASTVAKAE